MQLVTLATCNLNQWALDFSGNLERIAESIRQAKAAGARFRLGPELEICGYGCEDAFLEGDTLRHSWEVLAALLASDLTDGILCDVSLPVMHQNVRYNCRALLLDRKLLLLRPKMALAQDGNYREARYFAAWRWRRRLEPHPLPESIRELTGQASVPFGDGALQLRDTVLAAETCEELFTPDSPHINLGLDGVEIIANGSASHHELRKLGQRLDLIRSASAKNGGVYLYANQQGCDGGRLYFDGCAMIAVNGQVVAQGSQFSPRDVEVVTATIDLDEVRAFRGAFMSRMVQASEAPPVPRVVVDFTLSGPALAPPTPPQPLRLHTPQEEIALGPACWLWDYLRRSGMGGFFVPLSGGADSSAVVAIVGSMCQLVLREIHAGNETVLEDVRRVCRREAPWRPESAEVLAHELLHTCYMGSKHSSRASRRRAKRLADEVGAYHLEVGIDRIFSAWLSLFERATGRRPRFRAEGGSAAENLALQNIQARSRMVLAYFLAQLLPWLRGREGGLLVLGTANVDETLYGYVTKYDASSADLNPIGSVSKLDLRAFLVWAAEHLGYPSLRAVAEAVPSAELEPASDAYRQTDEADMGMSYAELERFGRLRKLGKCGPYETFERLVVEWDHLPPAEVADKVKRFFRHYAINRHKATVLTPAYHAEAYSPEDHRYDLRQFLYEVRWRWQFRRIDERVAELGRGRA